MLEMQVETEVFTPAPPGSAPPGAVQPGSATQGAAAMGSVPPGAVPPGAAPLGLAPPGAATPGLTPGLAPPATTLQEPSPPIDESFNSLAKTALAQSRETQGIAYLAADAVVTGNEDVLGSLRWSPTLKRPILAIRWGLATIVTQATKGGEAKPRGDASPAAAGGPIASPSGNIFGNGTGGLATAQAATPGLMPTPTPTPTPTPPPAARSAKKRPGDVSGAEAKTDYSISDPAAFWRQNVGVPLVEMLETHLNHGDFGSWLKDGDKKVGAAGPTVPVVMPPGQEDPSQSPAAGNQPPALLSTAPE